MKNLVFLIALLTIITEARAQRYRGFDDDYTKFRFGVQGGWSRRLAKVSEDVPPPFRSFIEGMKSGYHFGADGTFFLNRTWGLGIRYSGFRAGNVLNDVSGIDTSNGKAITANFTEKTMIQYVGPSVTTRYISENEWFQFLTSLSLGYLSYTDDLEIVSKYTFANTDVMVDKSRATGSTLGTVISLGADFAVHRNIWLGLEVSGMLGSLNGFDVETNGVTQHIDLPVGQGESLMRVDVSGGVRFNF